MVEIEIPRRGDENASPTITLSSLSVEIEIPRRGDENVVTSLYSIVVDMVEIEIPRRGDENQFLCILLLLSFCRNRDTP